MAVPILTVPVDDSAFKRYLDTFNKYQAQLKDQPEMWKGMTEGVDALAVAAAAMTAEVAYQAEETRKLMGEEAKREKLLEDGARRRKKEDDDQERRDKKVHDRRRTAIDQVREYGRTVTNAASGFGKWIAEGTSGGIGGLASGVGGGISATAVEGGLLAAIGGSIAAIGGGLLGSYVLAKSGAAAQYAGSGLGISSGQLQGYRNNLQGMFDVDSALGKVSAMQNDPNALSMWGMMGIQNPQGMSKPELMEQAALRARQMWIDSNKNVQIMGARRGFDIFGIQDLNRLADLSPAEIKSNFAKGNDFAKTSGNSADTGKKMQEFVNIMDAATDKIKNVLIDGLTIFQPVLVSVVKEFGNFADEIHALVPELSGWAKNLADLMNGGSYKNAWDYAGDAIGGPIGSWIKNHMGAGGSPSQHGASGSWGSGGGSGPIGGGNGSLADRNNNPGNIMRNGQFMHYPSLKAGYDAMAHQLMIDYDRHGQHSIRSIINDPRHGWSNEWSPGNTHESTANYIASVSRSLGVSADQDINLHDTRVLTKLMLAMNAVERGSGSGKHKRTTPSHKSHVHVKIQNQTGANVATTVNAAAGG